MTPLNIPGIFVLVFDSEGNSRNKTLEGNTLNETINYLNGVPPTQTVRRTYWPYGKFIVLGKVEKSNIDFNPQSVMGIDENTLRNLLKKNGIDFNGQEFTALVLQTLIEQD